MFCSSCGEEVAADKSFCSNCGAPAPKDDEAPAPAQTAVQTHMGVDAGMTPRPEQARVPAGPKRNRVVIGSVVAIIVVLAGVGVGLWLGLRGEDGRAAGSATTTVTIPGLDGGSGATSSTVPGGDGLAEYRTAVETIINAMESDNTRIPELADTINTTTPDVPQALYNELQQMLATLQTAHDAVAEITPPPAFEDATLYLMQAAVHMESRIQATMDGIQAGWDAGDTDAALPFYTTGRQQRDAYLASMRHFYEYVPKGTLPGD
jgi:hypothetical protein